jgi:hypothetical protein
MTQAPPSSSPPPVTASPEGDLNLRITELQAQNALLLQEIVTLEGKINNRDPLLLEKTKKENETMKQRFQILKKTLFAIISESYQPRTAEEAKLQYEVLRKATVEYCKKAKIGQEIWKSIES